MTDGAWLWALAWEDYIEYHRAAPPIDFMNHAEQYDWVAPELSEQRLIDLERHLGMPDD
ncbi:hypothetical protein [Nocardia sp. NPDC006630]|uniref:hypothetical protein n=1 Tax=Nocardia sp. NPDC006630 TaxID=3157181 RepID=UPI0033B682DB